MPRFRCKLGFFFSVLCIDLGRACLGGLSLLKISSYHFDVSSCFSRGKISLAARLVAVNTRFRRRCLKCRRLDRARRWRKERFEWTTGVLEIKAVFVVWRGITVCNNESIVNFCLFSLSSKFKNIIHEFIKTCFSIDISIDLHISQSTKKKKKKKKKKKEEERRREEEGRRKE